VIDGDERLDQVAVCERPRDRSGSGMAVLGAWLVLTGALVAVGQRRSATAPENSPTYTVGRYRNPAVSVSA
jgi:hypothetical protein